MSGPIIGNGWSAGKEREGGPKVSMESGTILTFIKTSGRVGMHAECQASGWSAALFSQSGGRMEFEDRNNSEIQRMVDLILETATNGLAWAQAREFERLDHEEDFVEWGPGDKNDERYLIEELAEPLPTQQLSIIKTILLLQ
jgi:hypothetical protein